MDIKKKIDETQEQYLWRIGNMVDSGEITSWESINDTVNKELLGEKTEKYKGESAWRKKFQAAKKFYNGCFSHMSGDEFKQDIETQKRELDKSRKKLQTEKIEYNKWLRENARDELIVEKIIDAISELSPIKIPDIIESEVSRSSYLCVLADAHYGVEFEIKDIFNRNINAYSPEIFEDRMWLLLNRIIGIVEKEGINKLEIFDLGDFCDGILRTSQLMKLRFGVIEQTIKYSEFMANWLNELSRYVQIRYQLVDGNHSELRMIGAPKGSFVDDNMGKVVREFIKIRLNDNPNFTIVENPSGMAYAMMSGFTVVGIHGETRNMENAIKDLSLIHGLPINYLIAGHLHHSKQEDVGIDTEVINVPSIIGVDPYGLSLNKTSSAGAKLICFENAWGKTCEYNIKLN